MKSIVLCLFVVLAIAQTTCVSPKVPVTLSRTYQASAEQEMTEIWEGNYLTGTKILGINGFGHASSTVDNVVCLNPTTHTLVAMDGAKDGWSDGSFFQLKTRAGIIILKGTLDRYQKAEFKFYPAFTVPSTASWKYSNVAQTGNGWAAQSFSDSTWVTYERSKFPVISTVTRYFRYTTELPASRSAFAIADIGAYSKEGIIVYVNGNEVFRRNLPATGVTATTPAVATDDSAAWRRMTIPATSSLFKVNGVDSSRVTVAVEVHGLNAAPTETTEVFGGLLLFVYGECNYRLFDGVTTSNKEPDYAGEPAAQLYDGDIQTKWYINNLDTFGPAEAIFTFNNGRREYINRYSVTTGNYDVNRRPYEWTVHGSNDGATWVLLDHRSQPVWVGSRQSLVYPMNTNTASYNKLKVTIIKAGPTGTGTNSEFGDVSFFACNTATETPALSYGVSAMNLVANMDQKHYYPTQNAFKNFSIQPAVPADGSMTFDPLTGSLYIAPIAAANAVQYTVTAYHESSTSPLTTSFSVSSRVCAYPNIRFDIYQRCGNSDTTGDAETVSLYNAGTRIFTNSLKAADSTGATGNWVDGTYKFCEAPAVYTVQLDAGTTNGFSGISYVSIDLYTYEDNNKWVGTRSNLRGALSRQYKFNAALIAPTTTKGLINSSVIPASWNTLGFDESAWTVPTNNLLSSTTKFLLVRHTFSIPSNTDYTGFELRYTTKSAVIIYVDGVEIVRYSVSDGELTAATTGGADSDSWRGVTGTLTTLPSGNHVIAIAYVNGAASTDNRCRAYVRLLTDSDDNSRTWDAQNSQSSNAWGSNDAGNLFDSNYNSRASLSFSGTVPQQWSGNFNGWRFETYNKFCIVTNWDAPHQDISTFSILGSTGSWDAEKFTTLYTVTDAIYEERSKRYCYYMPNQNKAYNIYRLSVNGLATAADKALLAELELYLVDFQKINVPALSYGLTSTVVGYVSATFTTLSPTTEYYTNFQISGGLTLPLGLTFSATSGTISGTPTAVNTLTTYTITATSIHGTAATATLSIEVRNCALPNTLVTLKFYDMSDDSNQNGFSFASVSGTTIMTVAQFPNYLNTKYYGFCVASGAYTLTLTDTHGDGWGTGKVDVIGDDNTVLTTSSCLAGESPKAVSVNVGYVTKFGLTSWKYTSGTVAADWNSATFNDAAWSTATTGNYINLSGNTAYFRYSASIADLSVYTLFDIKMKVTDGLVAYVNGVEIYRINLPTTAITGSTKANKQFTSLTTVSTSDSVAFGNLKNGNNVFAFELHKYADTLENTFDAQITLQVSGTNRATGGTVTTNNPGHVTEQWQEGEEKAFDADKSTKYYAKGCGKNTWLQYNFPDNRKEYVSSISISRGNNWNRMPDYYRLYGVDNTVESLLSSAYNFTFGTFGTAAGTLTYDFVNKKAYNQYKIYIDAYSCTEGLEIGEIELNAKRFGSYCEAEGTWFAVLEGQASTISCATGYYGVQRRTCSGGKFGPIDTTGCVLLAPVNVTYPAKAYVFKAKTYNTTPNPITTAVEVFYNITPALPSGLSIGRSSGIIAGNPSAVASEKTYTVTMCNYAGSNKSEKCVKTEVTISVAQGDSLSGGVIAIIVIAVIIIIIFIAFIVFIVINRTKGSKRGHKQMKTAKADTKKPASSGADKKVRI